MRTQRSDTIVDCFGCGQAMWRRVRPGRGRKAWCDTCAHIATDLTMIDRAAALLERYGLAESAQAMISALEKIREQLRTGTGAARHIAAVAADNHAKERDEWERAWQIKGRLYELIVGNRAGVGAGLNTECDWVDLFAAAVLHLIEPEEWNEEVLLARYRSFVEADLERIRASGCTCGHRRPHVQGVGCLHSGCGCGSPARARRAAKAAADARAWTEGDLLGAWPRLP